VCARPSAGAEGLSKLVDRERDRGLGDAAVTDQKARWAGVAGQRVFRDRGEREPSCLCLFAGVRGFKTTVRLENEAFRGVNRSFETLQGDECAGEFGR
jgi:hypothetical protein